MSEWGAGRVKSSGETPAVHEEGTESRPVLVPAAQGVKLDKPLHHGKAPLPAQRQGYESVNLPLIMQGEGEGDCERPAISFYWVLS